MQHRLTRASLVALLFAAMSLLLLPEAALARASCGLVDQKVSCSNEAKSKGRSSRKPVPSKPGSGPSKQRPGKPKAGKSGPRKPSPPPVRWHNRCGGRVISVDGGQCWVRYEQPRQPSQPGKPSGGRAPVQGEPAEPAVPVVTQRDFQSVPLSAAEVHVWPDGWGVAGKRTAFWTDDTTQTKTLTMLGQEVTVEAVPVSWRWDFGDGTVKWTHSPWRKPVSLERAGFYHVYSEAEHVKVTVTVKYEGRFRVGNGPWTDIEGTAEKTSPPRDVTIYRYEKYVVGEHCKKQNCLDENRANR